MKQRKSNILSSIGIKIFLLISVFGVFAGTAQGADVLGAHDGQNSNLVVPAAETHHNLYGAAANVTINGPTTGDAYAAGGTITVNGDVEQDLVIAGGNLTVNGKVGGDLRAAGGTILLNARVGGDVLAAGGTIMLSEKASVEGDVLAAGGNVDISSSVAGSLKVKAGSVRINSKVSGSVSVEAGQSLVFGPQAEVTGKVFYKGPQEATVQSGAKVSNIEFTRVENRGAGRHFKALFTGALLIKLLAWIAAILLLVRFLPRRTKTIVDLAYAKPWSNLGIGFVGLVLFPVAVIVLFLTLIGYYIAVVLLVTYIMILLLAMLLAALFVGNLIIRWLTKKPDAAADWQSVLIGVGVFTLLSFIPFVGWLACAILVLMVMGSMLKMLRAELV